MSFLDRFKSQPRWKHADPLVRLAAIPEIPEDDEHRGVVGELAAGDEDVRVRRAAIGRLADVPALVRLARSERDADLRRELLDRLVAIANHPAESGADAALALDGLDDERQFSTIAKQSPHTAVRIAALGRVQEVKALSSIARHGLDPQTALDAVARISEPAELLNVAVKTDHKDAGVAALERAVDRAAVGTVRETLDGVANRAKNKSVSKRARAMVQAIDDAESARRTAFEQWQKRVGDVVARAAAIAIRPSATDAATQLADTEQAWAQLAGDGTFETDTDKARQYGVHIATAKAAMARLAHEQEARRLEAERQEAARAARLSLCELVDNARAEDAIDTIEKARSEWEGFPGPTAREAADEELKARFAEACRRAAVRHQNRQDVQKTHARLEELSAEADRLSSEQAFSEEAWTEVRREWEALHPKSDALDQAIGDRYAAAEGRVRQREEERRAAAERMVKQQTQRIVQLIDRATARAAAEDLTLREADRLARELRTAIDAPPAMPERDRRPLVEGLRAAHALVSPKVHDLRELDEWKRFANAAVQEELIAKTEALAAKYGFDTPEGVKPEDLDKLDRAARELHEIQERWKQAADAPRAQAQALWHRYRQAADPIQTRVRAFFAQRMEERKGNLERKLALIERAEALSESIDWIKTADELKVLQAEWQTLGPVPRTETRVTWKRFREACDKFFTRRNEDLTQRKEAWSANLAKKEALCARAEELSTSRDWENAASEIRRLQVEWKSVGPVRRNKSEAMWQRFRTAADTFFDRYKRRDQIELEAKQGEREALVTELESLTAADRSDASSELSPEVAADIAPPLPGAVEAAVLLEQVRSLRSRWNQTSPTVRQGADPLSARFMGGLERLLAAYPSAFRGTDLDVEANHQKMETLCNRVEGFVSGAGPASPTGSSQALATMLREALASNTIGGRAGEEAKWRAMAEDVRQAQASWSRLGPVPGDAGRELGDRFHHAVTRFFDQFRRIVPPQQTAPRGGRPVGAR